MATDTAKASTNPREKKRRRSWGERISNRYFLVTLAVFVAIGIPAYFYLVHAVRQQFVGNYADFATTTATETFQGHLESVPGGSFTEPLEGERLESFLDEVEGEVTGRNLLKVKVWRPDGMLLYATSGQGVGQVREFDHHFTDAIERGSLAEIEEDEPEVAGEESSGQVLEIYLPIRGDDGELANIFELYYSLAPLNSDVADMRLTLLLFLGGLFIAVAGVGQLGGRLLLRRNRQLEALSDRLAQLAVTDELTGVANRRRFHERLAEEIAAATRYRRRLSLVIMDLDFFKQVNDRFGHQTGDTVLRETARAVAGAVREVDTVARYGGEEFAILMPETGETEAAAVAARLQRVVRDMAVAAGTERIGITASFGVAEYPTAGRDDASLVSAADSALYFAKRNGRDRVCTFSGITPGSTDDAALDGLLNRLRHAGVFTVQALAAAVNSLDGEPLESHDGSVPLARRAAAALGLAGEDTELLELAASVYDVGKIAVPGSVLSKAEALTPEEARAIQVHPETSERILSAVGGLEKVLTIVRHHHERFDGTGYPEGLKADAIPYLSRVLHVIDAFVAMTTDRPYRKALSRAAAIEELRANAGTQFDPTIVERLAVAVFGGQGRTATEPTRSAAVAPATPSPVPPAARPAAGTIHLARAAGQRRPRGSWSDGQAQPGG